MSENAVRRIVVGGTVQGVGFRVSCCQAASAIGLCGVVRNRPDGSVEIFAEGSPEWLEELIEWCRSGPPGARVSSVSVTEGPAAEACEPAGSRPWGGFRIVG
ncbi:MAG: acylphosphatase [Actinomycetota bacterium]|nr:acylphosphatase [Actinomycetota bacterium]